MLNEIVGVSFYTFGQMILMSNHQDSLMVDFIGKYLAAIMTGVVAINVKYVIGKALVQKIVKYKSRDSTVRI
jgi:hypothetical protein